jgi:integrase
MQQPVNPTGAPDPARPGKDTRRLERTPTPGVYRRGKTYIVRFRNRRGEARKRYVRTYDEARRVKASLTTDLARGEYRELAPTPFAEYAWQWLEGYGGRTPHGLRESTRKGYRLGVRTAVAYFGDRLLTEIEPADCRSYVTWLLDAKRQKRKLSVSTVRGKRLATLKLILACAVEDGLLRASPATYTRVTGPANAEPARKARALDREQLAAVLDAVDPAWRPFFALLASTGLRIGEALELRWRDVDLGRQRLRVERQVDKQGTVSQPKTRRAVRQVPLSTSMCRTLWRLQGAPDELLWRSPTGRYVDRRWLQRRILDPAAKAAGVEWLTFHHFRHTCASMLFDRGHNAVQVQRWLGHHSAAFTLATYIHLLDDDALGDGLDEAAWTGATDGATRPTSNEATGEAATSAESAG